MKAGIAVKPILMGAAMGLMMLGMVHMMMTGDSSMGGWALLVFIGGHLLVLLVLATAGLWLMRLSPRLHALLARLHRPSLSHFLTMIAGAAVAAGLMHLFLHGGL